MFLLLSSLLACSDGSSTSQDTAPQRTALGEVTSDSAREPEVNDTAWEERVKLDAAVDTYSDPELPLCERWKDEACDLFHWCGMMTATDDCEDNAKAGCQEPFLPLEPPEECAQLTYDDVSLCIRSLDMVPCQDLMFETIPEVTECVLIDDCFGWPM